VAWYYFVERSAFVTNQGARGSASGGVTKLRSRAEAIKKAKAKLKTTPCGTQVFIERVWVWPGSGVRSWNRKGAGTVWTATACGRPPR